MAAEAFGGAVEFPRGERILSNAARAALPASGSVCRYFSVVVIEPWPRRSLTTCRSAPPAGAVAGLAEAAGLIVWGVSVDSTINRAHPARRRCPHAAQKEPPGDEPADHGRGSVPGGLTTKIHLGCKQGRRPLSLVLTAGHRADSPQFTTVLEGIRVHRPGPGAASMPPSAGAGRQGPPPVEPERLPAMAGDPGGHSGQALIKARSFQSRPPGFVEGPLVRHFA